MSGLQQISFSVPATTYAALQKRAMPMNLRPAEYARRLFEAAWAARVMAEKGEASGDRDLDRQVRQVFLLADCEPEFIAEALGLPRPTVAKILAGWRQVAGEIAAGGGNASVGSRQTAVEVKALPAALPAPEKTQKVGGYPVETIRAMWAEGRSTKEIAAAIGRTEGALSMWMTKNRDVCPKRLPDRGNGKVHPAGAPREGQAA